MAWSSLPRHGLRDSGKPRTAGRHSDGWFSRCSSYWSVYKTKYFSEIGAVSRWLEIALTVAGAIIVAYIAMSGDIQTTKIRVDQLEKMVEEQRTDNRAIQALLIDIQIRLAKIGGER